MLKEEYKSNLEKRFYEYCQVIELKYEYPGYTGIEKYGIITSFNEDELSEYEEILSTLSPYIILEKYFSDIRQDYKRNEQKHLMRSIRGNIFSVDDSFDEHHPDCVVSDFSDLILSNMDSPVLRAVNSLNRKEKNRVIMYFFKGYSNKEIASRERVSPAAITQSINNALKKIEKILKNF